MTHGGQASIPEREQVAHEMYGESYKELSKEEKKETQQTPAGHVSQIRCLGIGWWTTPSAPATPPPEREAELEAAAERTKGAGHKKAPGGGS
ncbi:hypothetical protein GPECTOR_10g1065 [Gonium pectorale]|uniref:Uncharacterized protein n=1 Tax=Gonium pectorale TaxID=33097 RepID=A0A150GQM8_GONPE|nr:hypothetical protein GPECTOR_10g1065 [Gonium pectorale]|eukprot:KXZ52042.1 hypothetical protein GPECTOR_10g1065 [Gonium pectorale]